jgi:hypothetical protein
LLLDVASIVKSPMRSLRKAGGRFRHKSIDGAEAGYWKYL